MRLTLFRENLGVGKNNKPGNTRRLIPKTKLATNPIKVTCTKESSIVNETILAPRSIICKTITRLSKLAIKHQKRLAQNQISGNPWRDFPFDSVLPIVNMNIPAAIKRQIPDMPNKISLTLKELTVWPKKRQIIANNTNPKVIL
jgi:hypothetical protein